MEKRSKESKKKESGKDSTNEIRPTLCVCVCVYVCVCVRETDRAKKCNRKKIWRKR